MFTGLSDQSRNDLSLPSSLSLSTLIIHDFSDWYIRWCCCSFSSFLSTHSVWSSDGCTQIVVVSILLNLPSKWALLSSVSYYFICLLQNYRLLFWHVKLNCVVLSLWTRTIDLMARAIYTISCCVVLWHFSITLLPVSSSY